MLLLALRLHDEHVQHAMDALMLSLKCQHRNGRMQWDETSYLQLMQKICQQNVHTLKFYYRLAAFVRFVA